jgi:gamma-glutamyl:cysteine ligase YbdK (ATP-grasp superfamily)
MVVDRASLSVAPFADALLESAAGEPTVELERGAFAWNNELARHVIEFKTNGPSATLNELPEGFAGEVSHANELLASQGRQLMPTGMHPWMDPATELRLWDQDDREIYEAFDRIFSCKGHGWANLQSMHLNLPFADDAEFARLHAAIRFLLPIMPGLSASSPLIDGVLNGTRDNRLAVYRGNCARVPSVAGAVIPEPVYSQAAYRKEILQRIYDDMAGLDPSGVLRHEWVNARGAIARFDRMALEIRVLDTQECPAMDIAFARVIVATLKALCAERWLDLSRLKSWRTEELARGFTAVIEQAEKTDISDRAYLSALGVSRSRLGLHALWAHLAEQAALEGELDAPAERALEHYLSHGSLASRITAALPAEPGREDIGRVYRELCECLATGSYFVAR